MKQRKKGQVLLPWVVLSLAVACSTGNPIIGRWKVDDKESLSGVGAGLGLVGMDEIEFRADKMIMGSVVLEVSYEVDEDRVIVTNKKAGHGQVFRILDEDRIKFEVPMGLAIVYRRAE